MNSLDEVYPSLPASWRPKETSVSDSEDDSSSSSDDEGLDSFDANPCNGEDGLEGDDEEETFFVATAEDVAAWEAGLSAPPRPAHRELCYADGGRYLGETLGGLRHGRGTLEYTNGDTYEGVWRLGLRHGKGKAVFPSRRTKGGDDVGYDGDWLDDKADGQGRATYENGGIYEGAFSNGIRCGWGRHTFPPPADAPPSEAPPSLSAPSPLPPTYEGEWLDDAPHGQGVHSCPVSGTFVGAWERGSRARGCWTSADGGEEYEGGWAVVGGDAGAGKASPSSSPSPRSSNDADPLTAAVRHGKGTCTLRGVSKYSGDWENDKPSGRGECRYVDGSVFVGGWKGGRRHGRGGELRRADGSFFVGEWLDALEHGHGKALLSNGDEYEGDWEQGKRHGEGRGTCGPRSEDSYVGGWRAGERHGAGRCIFASGDVYEGQWERDERHGFGSCVFKEDGVRFSGVWQRGKWVQGAADAALSEPISSGETDAGDAGGDDCLLRRTHHLHFLRAESERRSAFRIRARDSKGQPRLSGGDRFVVWVECGVSDRGDEEEGGGGEEGKNSKALVAPAARAASSGSDSSPFERVDAQVEDRGDGTYDVSYVPRVAGEARLHVSLLGSPGSSSPSSSSSSSSSFSSSSCSPSSQQGSPSPSSSTSPSPSPSSPSFVPVADSPYTLLVEPGPPQKRQELILGLPREIERGGGGEGSDGDGKRVTFWVQPRDGFGNACGPCPSAFSVAAVVASSSSGSFEARAETRQLADGRVECSFPPKSFAGACPLGRGVVEVMVRDSAAAAPRHARGSPFSLNVVDVTSSSSSSSSSSSDPPASATPSVEDKTTDWNKVAEEAFLAVDGDGTGWESDGGDGKGGEGQRRRGATSAAADEDSAESLAAAHPGVPIVERLEDIWQVAKLHRERKEKEERESEKDRRGNEENEDEEEDESDALGAAQAAAKAAEDASRAAVVAAAAQKVV